MIDYVQYVKMSGHGSSSPSLFFIDVIFALCVRVFDDGLQTLSKFTIYHFPFKHNFDCSLKRGVACDEYNTIEKKKLFSFFCERVPPIVLFLLFVGAI